MAPRDWLNFPWFNPVHDLDLPLETNPVIANPTIRSARFRELIEDETYRKVRFRPFRMHFQFLMSNDMRGAYDFFAMTSGPQRLHERARMRGGGGLRRKRIPVSRVLRATTERGSERMQNPTVIVVMGVSGSGKTTVAGLLARRLGWTFADGDDLHSAEHVAWMRAGHALGDTDREPWLALIKGWIDARLAAGESGLITCSALRRSYRVRLVASRPNVRIVYLEGSRDLIARRLKARRGHFMPAGLLDSQFATLEPPSPEEHAIIVGIEDDSGVIAAHIVAQLDLS